MKAISFCLHLNIKVNVLIYLCADVLIKILIANYLHHLIK